MANNIIDTILQLHKEGYSIIPSGKGPECKAPAVPWADYQKKQPLVEQFRSWLRQTKTTLWGIVTGKLSSIVVVDRDAESDPTVMGDLKPHIKTPHGCHYWFQYPDHHVKTCAGVLAGIDIRGDGGFANCIGINPN
ncbi:bifunctional DNA primase/polymerase [Chloroflexota bacterium]